VVAFVVLAGGAERGGDLREGGVEQFAEAAQQRGVGLGKVEGFLGDLVGGYAVTTGVTALAAAGGGVGFAVLGDAESGLAAGGAEGENLFVKWHGW